MTRALAAAALAVLALLAGCTRHHVAVATHVHYVVGAGYQADGTWFYPHEDFHYVATGLASVQTGAALVTADGEAAGPTAMTAAHQTLQLPCIARVTDLSTGRQVEVRINDRGPASPARLIALSPRAAEVLGVPPAGAARVRVEVEDGPSLALREQLHGGPHLVLAAAPRGTVTAEALPPPPGVEQSRRGRNARPEQRMDMSAGARAATVPDRLPETVVRVAPHPGTLMIDAGTFGRIGYARQVAARLVGIGAGVRGVRDGRAERYAVQAGPFADVPAADAALDRALAAGVSDARIVVD